MNRSYYYHVDVFGDEILSGNGLTVFLTSDILETEQMQKMAQEFKQFETIFICKLDKNLFHARIFTVEEELDFAGHPVLGAAAVVHEHFFARKQDVKLTFRLKKKDISLSSSKKQNKFFCEMNQGIPEFLGILQENDLESYMEPLNLTKEQRSDTLKPEVVSTGLPYLLIPIKEGIDQAKILTSDYGEKLSKIGAKFVYIFDENRLEGRTWDNLGKIEDVATGSAAGPVGAFLYKYGVPDGKQILLHQGSFVGRPSVINIHKQIQTGEIFIGGPVCILLKTCCNSMINNMKEGEK